MPYREFRFHRGGGSMDVDQEPVWGIYYDDGTRRGAILKDVSTSIARLIRRGEWCYECDLELPEPIHSSTIVETVTKAIDEGLMNLTGLPADVIAGRLKDQRCPCCGALLTPKMIDLQLVDGAGVS